MVLFLIHLTKVSSAIETTGTNITPVGPRSTLEISSPRKVRTAARPTSAAFFPRVTRSPVFNVKDFQPSFIVFSPNLDQKQIFYN